MVDIDEVVTSFCGAHLAANAPAFADARLQLIHDDARAQLEQWPGKFDVIIGDLADPVEGGPCYQAPPLPLPFRLHPSAAAEAKAPGQISRGRPLSPVLLSNVCGTVPLGLPALRWQALCRGTQQRTGLLPDSCPPPALQLYTAEFYERVVKAKLNPGGVFVTQSGPAGVLSASQARQPLPASSTRTTRHSAALCGLAAIAACCHVRRLRAPCCGDVTA